MRVRNFSFSLEGKKVTSKSIKMSIDKITSEDKKHFGDVTSVWHHNGILFSSGSDAKIKVR